MSRRAWTTLFPALFFLAILGSGCAGGSRADEKRKIITVIFTNDVLGEYAPCG